jgi:tetratricopeptide (TPR) repeat protein
MPQPKPDPHQLWVNAQHHIQAQRFPAARTALETLLEQQPWQVPARMLLASVILAQGKLREATAQLKLASFTLPDDPDLICRLAQVLNKVGETNAVRGTLRHPAIATSRNGPALAALGHIFQGIGLHEQALALMDRAKATGFDNPDFRYFRALQLQFNGRLAETEAELVACLRMGPTYGRASLTLARLRKWSADDNHLDFIAERIGQVAQGSEDHAGFEFARHKELEDLGRYDEAWAALERANNIMAERLGAHSRNERELFAGIAALCTPEFLADTAPAQSGPVPIFILGMPRSGTTLLERILGNHPQVASPGELADFPRQLRWTADRHGRAVIDPDLLADAATLDYAELGRRYLEQTQWRAGDKAFYVDKLPPNFQVAGLIHKALPQARILHMVRDPMDVCFSNWRALFGDSYAYSYAMAPLAEYYREYRGLMAHWHAAMPGVIHDVSYADLVTDTDATARAALEYCGLEYTPGLSDIANEKRTVATLSSVQVRQPIHTRGLAEWKRYETQLEPLRAAIADLL